MTLPPLMAVTAGDVPAELERALEALGGEVAVQLRDKEAPRAELEARARRLATRCVLSINMGGAGVELAASAAALGARFVHLPEAADLPATALPHGRSVHSAEAAGREAANAAYLIAGPVWPTAGKPAAIGLEALASICAAAGDTPVFAIGGILGADEIRAVVGAGARGIAGIRAFSGPRLVEFAGLMTASILRS